MLVIVVEALDGNGRTMLLRVVNDEREAWQLASELQERYLVAIWEM